MFLGSLAWKHPMNASCMNKWSSCTDLSWMQGVNEQVMMASEMTVNVGTGTGTWSGAEFNIYKQGEDRPDDFILSQTYFFVSLWKFLCYAKSDKLALHVSGISEQNVTIISGSLEVHVGKRVSALLRLVLWNAWCALSICWDGAADDQCTAAACLCLRRRQEMRPWNMTMWLSNFAMSNAVFACTKLTVAGKPWALNAKTVRRQYLMSILKAFGIVFN